MVESLPPSCEWGASRRDDLSTSGTTLIVFRRVVDSECWMPSSSVSRCALYIRDSERRAGELDVLGMVTIMMSPVGAPRAVCEDLVSGAAVDVREPYRYSTRLGQEETVPLGMPDCPCVHRGSHPELLTRHHGVISGEAIVTDCAPNTAVEDLQSA